jgi:uncharacterized protein YjbI with pentapeptide repeats
VVNFDCCKIWRKKFEKHNEIKLRLLFAKLTRQLSVSAAGIGAADVSDRAASLHTASVRAASLHTASLRTARFPAASLRAASLHAVRLWAALIIQLRNDGGRNRTRTPEQTALALARWTTWIVQLRDDGGRNGTRTPEQVALDQLDDGW